MVEIEKIKKIAKKNLEKNKLKELKEIDKGIILAAKKGKMYLYTKVRFLSKEDIEMIYGREGYKVEYESVIPGLCYRVDISWER